MSQQEEAKHLHQENQRLKQKLEGRIRELSILYEVGREISFLPDREKLARFTLTSLHRLVKCDVSAVLTLGTPGRRGKIWIYRSEAGTASPAPQVRDHLFKNIEALMENPPSPGDFDVMEENLPQPSSPYAPAPASGGPLAAHASVPLLIEQEWAGFLAIYSHQERAFTEQDLRLLSTVSNLLGSAFQGLERLRSAERSKIGTLIESLSDGILLTDENGRLDLISPSAKRIIGLTDPHPVEIDHVFSRFTDARSRPLHEQAVAWLRSVLAGEAPVVSKEVYLAAPSERVIRIQIEALRSPEGPVVGAVTLLYDITKQKQLDRMKSEFISTVSHELRTPLTVIRGALGNLKDGAAGLLTEKQSRVVETAERNILRLSRIINDLLDLSRLESGKARMNRRTVDTASLIHETLENFEGIAREKHIALVPDLRSPLPNLTADADMLTQVLSNLLDNALRFAKEQVVVRVQSEPGALVFSVIDDGPGIASDQLERLFNKFEQIHRPEGGGYKGTGLGLAICKEIIDHHRGKIWAESPPGQGARFHYSIPL